MYKVVFSEKAKKELKKLDKQVQRKLLNWIIKNLDGCSNYKAIPNYKELKGNLSEYFRYRIGNYRIICTIENDELIIQIISVGHRKNVYK